MNKLFTIKLYNIDYSHLVKKRINLINRIISSGYKYFINFILFTSCELFKSPKYVTQKFWKSIVKINNIRKIWILYYI
jgi:hypothetical protein